jgi:hypothetical protein
MTITRVLLGSLVTILALARSAAVSAQIEDHLKCYRITDPLKLAAVVDLHAPELGLEPGCEISKPMLYCVAATKTVISATDKKTGLPITLLPVDGPPTDDRICYKLRCPTRYQSAEIKDQFGQRIVGKLKSSLLCTPARLVNLQTCGDNPAPTCGGTCPEGSRCFDHGGSCACSPDPYGCDSALAPSCDGTTYNNVGASCEPAAPACQGGSNSGASCSADSECPQGMCARCASVIANQCAEEFTPPFASPPNCIGECARQGGGTCVAGPFGGCQCASGGPPCGTASAPQCDGFCNGDAACTDVGGTCTCVSRACGEVEGAPACLGTCLFGVCQTTCVGGPKAGAICAADSECPSSTCSQCQCCTGPGGACL